MHTSTDQIARLIYQLGAGTIEQADLETLNAWADADPRHRQWLDSFQEEGELELAIQQRAPKALAALEVELLTATLQRAGLKSSEAPVRRIHFLKKTWVKYAAAIILIFGIGAYFVATTEKNSSIVRTTEAVQAEKDVAPGSNKATLTLSDGRTVALTAQTTELTDAGSKVKNYNGRIEYTSGDKAVLNTMSTPRGGQYQLSLPDGTEVWLDSASSITYPTAFTGSTRQVRITGEAYFEVKKDRKKPFIVKTATDQVTVLGTHFNINAYPDEPAMKTSLLEGAVKINNVILKAGQAYMNGKLIATNVDQDIAWKNGYFNFDGADLKTVLRQLGRWYDIRIEYLQDVPKQRFGGRIRRDLNLSELLNLLRSAGIKYEFKDNTLYIH